MLVLQQQQQLHDRNGRCTLISDLCSLIFTEFLADRPLLHDHDGVHDVLGAAVYGTRCGHCPRVLRAWEEAETLVGFDL